MHDLQIIRLHLVVKSCVVDDAESNTAVEASDESRLVKGVLLAMAIVIGSRLLNEFFSNVAILN